MKDVRHQLWALISDQWQLPSTGVFTSTDSGRQSGSTRGNRRHHLNKEQGAAEGTITRNQLSVIVIATLVNAGHKPSMESESKREGRMEILIQHHPAEIQDSKSKSLRTESNFASMCAKLNPYTSRCDESSSGGEPSENPASEWLSIVLVALPSML